MNDFELKLLLSRNVGNANYMYKFLIFQTLGTSSVRGFLFVGERYHMRGVTGSQLFIPLTNLIE
ncbi:hypothetical protein BN1180_04688 [Peribacillus simplex]|uniref:Uncharacterized protein n=1 Tax=Peribacillus simplex TaxID=1478 RepID=A0AAN2PKN7_9BACI|nr:hypothetical protein BN1180_04688 [Peribacillus simplex]